MVGQNVTIKTECVATGRVWYDRVYQLPQTEGSVTMRRTQESTITCCGPEARIGCHFLKCI